MVDRFVTDYLTLLDGRLESVHRLLSATDSDRVVVSLLSLETSSAMMAADDVVGASRALRTAVTARQRDHLEALFAVLVSSTTRLRDLLEDQGFTARSVP